MIKLFVMLNSSASTIRGAIIWDRLNAEKLPLNYFYA